MESKPLRMAEISRALAKHDASTVYTLLRERYSHGVAGRALMELIKTQEDWPKAEIEDDVKYDQRLTPRELEVLRYSEQGLGTIDIAYKIPASFETIKHHKRHIYTKLGVNNILEAIHMGRELGLL
jgi:LuxR family maltose regulon positive regulatory protein